MTERDICTKFITPALKSAGWDIMRQIKEEYTFTDGKIHVKGKIIQRGKRRRTDYILFYKPNIPIAIIEAKDNKHNLGDGMQQGLKYAEILDVPFVYSSNGDGFLEHDRLQNIGNIEIALPLDQFPSPEELWERYCKYKNITESEVKPVTQDYFFEQKGKNPRYYQRIAVNRSVESIIKGQKRLLLVLATGTGKPLWLFK